MAGLDVFFVYHVFESRGKIKKAKGEKLNGYFTESDQGTLCLLRGFYNKPCPYFGIILLRSQCPNIRIAMAFANPCFAAGGWLPGLSNMPVEE